MTTQQLIQQEAERKYLYITGKHDHNVAIDIFREHFLKGATFGASLNGWVSVKDRPLFTNTVLGWECTTDAEGTFMAAVEQINNKTNQVSWWIQHCFVKDGIGLCVISEDDDSPAGYELSDVQYYLPINPPIVKP